MRGPLILAPLEELLIMFLYVILPFNIYHSYIAHHKAKISIYEIMQLSICSNILVLEAVVPISVGGLEI